MRSCRKLATYTATISNGAQEGDTQPSLPVTEAMSSARFDAVNESPLRSKLSYHHTTMETLSSHVAGTQTGVQDHIDPKLNVYIPDYLYNFEDTFPMSESFDYSLMIQHSNLTHNIPIHNLYDMTDMSPWLPVPGNLRLLPQNYDRSHWRYISLAAQAYDIVPFSEGTLWLDQFQIPNDRPPFHQTTNNLPDGEGCNMFLVNYNIDARERITQWSWMWLLAVGYPPPNDVIVRTFMVFLSCGSSYSYYNLRKPLEINGRMLGM